MLGWYASDFRFSAPECLPATVLHGAPTSASVSVEPEATTYSVEAQCEPRRTPEEKITFMLDALKQLNWTLGDFLHYIFRLPGTIDSDNPRHTVPPRSVSHGTVVGKFLKGNKKHGVAELVGFWLNDPSARPSPRNKEYPLKHSPSVPWKGIRHAHTALTSMAVQLCEAHLVREQHTAVRGAAGLHGSAPAPCGHHQISWEDISSRTFSRVQEILEEHQPCAVHIIKRLAMPAPRRDNSGDIIRQKKRPPEIVS